ncbi:MAG: hypothetical protein AAF709_04115 [Pseudomonadota bacterium]
MRRVAPPPLTVLLCAVLAGFAWRALDQDGFAEPTVEPLSSPVSAKQIPQEAPLRSRRTEKSDDYYAAVFERPLFTEERRPFVPQRATTLTPAQAAAEPSAVTSEEPVSPTPPDITLKGVMIDPEHRSALIEFPSGEAQWIDELASIGDWQLVQIGANSITIAHSGVTHVLPLYKRK